MLFAAAGGASAQEGPLRIVVAAPPGGITDTFARLLAEPLAAALGQPVIVDNKPGASGAIAARAVLQAPADGRTLYFGTPTSLSLPPLLKEPPPFDTRRDFAPVAWVAGGDGVLAVHADVPATTVQQFVAHAKANPGKLNYASAGIASMNHLAMELFKDRLGLDIVHVPFAGAAPAVNALLAGQVQATMGDLSSLGVHIKAGKLRALAQIGPERLPQLPDVPTLAETVLPGYRATFWLGLVAREGTPAPLLARLNEAVNKAAAASALRAHAAQIGFAVHNGPPADLAALIAHDTEVWGALIRKHRITAQ